jgi:hypothetical protein
MNIRYTIRALADLEEIGAYLRNRNPARAWERPPCSPPFVSRRQAAASEIPSEQGIFRNLTGNFPRSKNALPQVLAYAHVAVLTI